MRIYRAIAAWAVILAISGAAWAQADAPAAAEKPAAEPIMGHLPAGAMGYIVVNSAKDTVAKVEKFLGQIGMGDMLGQQTPGGLMQMIQAMAMLGEGFNPNGGVAVVMLDPQQFGVNLLQLLGMEEGADAPPAEKPKLPFVLMVPGTGVKEVFGLYEMAPEGKYTKIKLRMGEMLAVQCGGYVMLSPNDKALEAVLGAQKKAADELTKDQVELLKRSDLGLYFNMKVVSPLYAKLMGKVQEQMAAEPEAASILAPLVTFVTDMMAQVDAAVVGVQLADTGVIIEEMVTFTPGSAYGKALAASKPAAKAPIDRLPNLPYVLACGTTIDEGVAKDQMGKLLTEVVDKVLALPAMAKITDDAKARLRKVVADYIDQVTGFQMVGGGAPAGSGVMGLGCLIQCKDAEEVKALLAEEARLAEEIIKALVTDEDVQQLKITYDKGVDSVGGVSVDSITVAHPELANMAEDDRAQMTAVLGEDKIRVLVAAADKNTVVVTFGGGKAFLAEAISAAQKGGNILTDPGTLQVMKFMPKNTSGLMLLNVGNLFEVIAKGMKAVEPDGMLPFSITCKTPIAAGWGAAGNAMHQVAYIPNDLIKEVAGIVKMFIMGPQMEPAPAPGRGPNDF